MNDHDQVSRAIRKVAESLSEVDWLVEAATDSLNPLTVPLDRLMPYLRQTPFAIISAWDADRFTAEENRRRHRELVTAVLSTAGINGEPLGLARCLGHAVEPETKSQETGAFRSVAQPALLVPGISFDEAWVLAKRFDEWSFIRDRGDGSVNLYRTETREREAVADLTPFGIIADLRNLTDASSPGRSRDLVQKADADPLGVLTSKESDLTQRLLVIRDLVLVESRRHHKELAWLQLWNVQVGVIAENANGSPQSVLHFFAWWRGQPRQARLNEGNVVRWSPLFQWSQGSGGHRIERGINGH